MKNFEHSFFQNNRHGESLSYNSLGLTPLHHIIKNGELNDVKTFLKTPKNQKYLNAKSIVNWDDHTPLMMAVFEKKTDIADFLIDRGANLFATSKLGYSAVDYAIQKKDHKIASRLITEEGCPVLEKNYPLHIAAENTDFKMIQLLMKTNINPNIKDNSGFTALDIALKKYDVDSALLLVEYGTELNRHLPKRQNWTPLHIAIGMPKKRETAEKRQKKLVLVKKMIEKGAHVNALNNVNRTPLHIAYARQYPEIIDLLLENNARMDIKDHMERTPLDLRKRAGFDF